MNGIECLKQELLDRGYTKQQAESKVVLGVLEILAQDREGRYSDMKRAQEEIDQLKDVISRLESRAEEYRKQCAILRAEIQRGEAGLQQQLTAIYQRSLAQIEEFQRTLEQAETDEARDLLRLAQMYVNTVNVNTVYDNTAFIIGLAAVLSGGKSADMKQLKKIDAKIRKPTLYYDGTGSYRIDLITLEEGSRKGGNGEIKSLGRR